MEEPEDAASTEPAHKKFWHPIRFAKDLENGEIAPDFNDINFRYGKIFASGILRGIATGGDDDDISKVGFEDAGIGLTTEYVEDRIDKLLNYNDNDIDFHQIKLESLVMNDLWENYDDNAVMYLDDNDRMQVAKGVEDSLVENIWRDDEGQYDDMDQYLKNNGQMAAIA